MDGRWVPIDQLLEDLDRDDWADRTAQRQIEGEAQLESERQERGQHGQI